MEEKCYTIGQVAELTGLSIHTLRYYEREGLLPSVGRTSSGQRRFTDSDLEWLHIVNCLKSTGMQLRDIRTYIDWCVQGDETLPRRLDMIRRQKAIVQKQMAELDEHMRTIDHKLEYYESAVAKLNARVGQP